MYDKIAKIMNSNFGSSDMDSDLVERYLRNGDIRFISKKEALVIEVLLNRYVN